uniref:Uncharacterized protein n=1 Tax=Meloidogyne enterolobii TaxID=390850 RepID=A0A6V7WZ30_MELEN|nr:unnamed protein product [Meloidogyne enterolobii]
MQVCESKLNVCFHYGVSTCRACGAFFRRYIENEGECKYKCKCLQKQLLKGNKNGKSQTNLAKCQKCRLEKCLSVGMKKLDVGYLRQDICLEAMREQNNEINLPTPPIVDISINDQKQIELILAIIEAKKRIMHSFNNLDDSIFLKGPILFEEIILSNLNICSLIDYLSQSSTPISFGELNRRESSVQNESIQNQLCHKYFLIDRFVCVGIAKSMPVFDKLTLSDQIAHLRHISYKFTAFTGSYLAWELGSETWIRKDCVIPALGDMRDCEYLYNDRMIKWSELLFTKSVVHFKRVALTKIEFALLIAIIFTKSNAEDLSVEGKELLYNESVKFTNILLQYNQRRLGVIEGAQRLDECIRLINVAIENEHFMRLILSHQLECYPMDSFKFSNFFENFLKRSD